MQTIKETWQWLVPPEKTPEERLQEARDDVTKEVRLLRNAQTRNELEQEDALRAFDKATEKKDRRVARTQAEKLIMLERQAKALGGECSKMTSGQEQTNRVVRDQVLQRAQVTAMAYSNSKALTLQQITGVTTRYEMNKDANSLARDAIAAALDDSDEELEKETRTQYTAEEQLRMRELMAGYDRQVDQTLIANLPPIDGTRVSTSLLDMDPREVSRKTQSEARQLSEFLAHAK